MIAPATIATNIRQSLESDDLVPCNFFQSHRKR